MPSSHPIGARASLGPGLPAFVPLDPFAAGMDLAQVPVTVKILLENALRHVGGGIVTEDDVRALAAWSPGAGGQAEIPFLPARVIMQDFTGVPGVVDLAAMRDAIATLGGDPGRVNPLVPVDLVIDHSVQVDRYGTPGAFAFNVAREYERNGERYQLLRWAQRAFRGLRVVPPGTGIVHQVNLEHLATVVVVGADRDGTAIAYPDTLVGTDSHTTMINALGVLGYGVGGIEAEAVLLGQPLYQPMPRVVGVRLHGELPNGTTATDLVLTVTEQLRTLGVVGAFVEFAGDGLAGLALADRATISNMSPEFGATATLFPIDDETLRYLRLTGRSADLVALVERYAKVQGLWREPGAGPSFDQEMELDLGSIEPSLAGPRRPQDRVSLPGARASFEAAFPGLLPPAGTPAPGPGEVRNGSVVIAAITSCTNTSNPSVMIGAGLLAKKAIERGLSVAPTVKTSLAPGSRAVMAYLERAGLVEPLATLGFALAGYGCTTCIGNSGPLDEAVAQQIEAGSLVAAAVLSGNRNFEGRIHPLARASYLASPPLVVAYALAGRMDLDLAADPLGVGSDGRPVHLADIWPTPQEVRAAVTDAVNGDLFRDAYASVFDGDDRWRALPVPEGERYAWDPASTYVANPPFFEGMTLVPEPVTDIVAARVLAWLGDSVTTDHISPAGSIAAWAPAGQWLQAHGVAPLDFNSFGSRRGHHEVMMRGTFGNIRLKNRLTDGKEGPYSRILPDGTDAFLYDAAMTYRERGVPAIILAGREYGSGSSRDWAAKGTLLLGVRAVIAESYERIHRSNLVGMGVLPLQFLAGQSAASLGLTGRESYTILGLAGGLVPRSRLTVVATADAAAGGAQTRFGVDCRLDGPIEVGYYEQGGILPAVVRRIARESRPEA